MAQDLFTQLAQQTLANISTEGPAEVGDDPVSAIYQVAQERGIDPAHLLGLAKLETQAGAKTVKGGGADTRNLFNVKDFSNGNGGIRARDKAEGSNDRYRTYGSYRESVEDLAGLLERRYPGAAKADSPEAFARELKRGGYATDPAYESKLARVIRSSGGAARPAAPAQEWDQGARYAPVGVTIAGTDKPQPAEKPKEGAGFWEGTADVGLAAAQGVVGSVKAITDLAGADNAVSRSLDDASKGIEKTKSDASQADRKYHQQKIREAEASGDWKDEVAAYANMVWDMPLESLAQGIGSFATLGAGKVAQMAKLASAAKKAGVTKEAFLKTAQGVEAAKQASNLGAKVNVGLGVGQGIGGVKGSQYEQTFNAAKESGLSDEQAQALATEAQSYQQGWGQQLVGAGLGYLAGKTGPIEKLASGQTVGAGGVARRFIGGGLVEAGTEGLQGGQERYAGNAAAIDAGVLDESKRWAGVAGSGTSEAITAGILGGGAGALGRPDVDPQAQAKAAAQKSGGIVSRAGLAATPGAQQPAGQTGQAPAGSATAAPAQPTSVSAAPNPNFADMDDEGLKVLGEYLTTRQAMMDGTPISDEDRKVGQEALAELARRQAAATASPAPAVSQNAIQASALSAIEQALQADQQRRRAAGEVVDDDVTDVEVKAPAQPATKPPLSNEPDPMLPQAIDFLRQGGKPSVSAVQRNFRIGYNRAAKMLESMEREGLVGPLQADGSRQMLQAPPHAAPAPQQPASAGFSSPVVFDNSPIPKMDPAEADEQRRQFAEFEQKRKNRRAGTRASAWERNPFMAFLGANGLNRDTAGEFAPGLTERRKAFVPGYGPVFRPGAKNLDELVQTAKEDGFLRDDDGEPELYDLIDRALRGERIAPLFADGAAEAEGQRRQQAMQEREGATFEDYLEQQRAEMESNDFDPLDSIGATGYDFGDDDLADYAAATPTLQAEVSALAQHYYDLGFDPDEVLERLSIETENQPEQAYYDLAKSRFTQLIEQALSPGRREGSTEQGGGGAVRRDAGQTGASQADGSNASGQGQAAAVAPAPSKRADAIRAKLDTLKAQGFSQFTRAGGRNLLLNPGTYETVELSPAEVAVSKAMSQQARAGLQSLRGRREPVRPQEAVLQSYTPADVLTQQEQATQQKADEQAARTRSEAEAQASDERRRIQQASFAAADSFELGQNPLDSLTGQQDIFSSGQRSPQAEIDAPAAPTRDHESDMRLYPTQVLGQIIEQGNQAKLFAKAGVRGATAFAGLNADDQAKAYAAFVADGGKPASDLPKDYNEYVQGEEHQVRRRQLQSEHTITQANGKPFKTEVGAKAALEQFDLGDTHKIVNEGSGYALRQMPVAEQAEKRRIAEGRESYMEAQAAVIAGMGIPLTADGEIDATNEQWDEIDQRIAERLGQKPIKAKSDNAITSQLSAIAGELDAMGATRRAAIVREWMSDDLSPSAGDVQDAQDLLDQVKKQREPDPVAELLNQHFKLSAGLTEAFNSGKGDAKNQLRLMDESNQATKKLIELGYTQDQLGANALGITVDHFKEMVKDGFYSREYGARDELFKQPAAAPAQQDGRVELTDQAAASQPSTDQPIASKPFATSIEKTKTGWVIKGDPDALAQHARDIFGKGVVKRKDGISLATKTEDVAGNFPVRFDEYRLVDLPERHGRIEVRVNQDGSASVRSLDGGYMGPMLPSVAEAIANHRKEFGDGEAMPATSEQPNAAPAKTQAETRKGEVGMKLESGEQVLTNTGRKTTPFPKVSLDTNRKASNTLKLVDRWLMQNALDEARSRSDEFNARQFEASLEKPQQADKDAAEEYLFGGYIPAVVPSILKPLVADGGKPTDAQAAPAATTNADLEAIFDQLDGITQRTQAAGQQAAAAHPQAERIQFVQKHILDILEDLEDSGKVTINC